MTERIEDNDMDLRLIHYEWGAILSFNEKAMLEILALIPAASTPIDRVMRTIAIHSWLRRQGHTGAVLMRAIDGGGEPIGQEDEPALGIELTSQDYTDRLQHKYVRSKQIVAPSHPEDLEEDCFWMECVSISPEIEGDLIEAMRDEYEEWIARIWEVNLAWIQNSRTPMLAKMGVQTTKGAHDVECLKEYIEFKAMQSKGDETSWRDFISERIHMGKDETLIFVSDKSGPQFCFSGEARLAKMRAREIDKNTLDIKTREPRPGARL